MGDMTLLAIILAMIAGFNPHFTLLSRGDFGAYLFGWLWRTIGLTVIMLLSLYMLLPACVGPLGGGAIWLLISLCAVVNINLSVRTHKADYRSEAPGVSGVAITGVIVFILGGIGVFFLSTPMFNAEAYAHMLGTVTEKDWNQAIQQVDPQHLRMVSRRQAIWRGNKVLGEAPGAIGSRFRCGEYTIQRVKGRLYWVAPLEFNGLSSWLTYGATSGYVMVSAENRDEPARLINSIDNKPIEMKYLASAWFGKKISRFIYTQGYMRSILIECSFEVDESLSPYWVMTLAEPTIGWGAPKVTGILVVDAQTGASQHFTTKDAPDWIDRIHPERTTEDYVRWWGEYSKGWINSWWQNEGTTRPTPHGSASEDVYMIYGKDGEPYWCTGITSTSSSDQALTGIMLVGSRSGKATYCNLPGINEQAAMEVADSAVANFDGYHATQPIPYNIYGQFAWVMPITSKENIFQRLAIVQGSNSQIAIGENREEALHKFRAIITHDPNSRVPGSQAEGQTVDLVISRISSDVQNGNTLYYLYSDATPTKIFTGSSATSAELPLAQPGDRAKVSFMDTHEEIVPMTGFDLDSITLKLSDEQIEANQDHAERKSAAEHDTARRALRQRLEQMTDLEFDQFLEERAKTTPEK